MKSVRLNVSENQASLWDLIIFYGLLILAPARSICVIFRILNILGFLLEIGWNYIFS